MRTAGHTLTTTAHTASGLVPICHCGWTPGRFVGTLDEVALMVVEHNEGFLRDECPDCGGPLEAREATWTVMAGARHFTDKMCPGCGWKASSAPH